MVITAKFPGRCTACGGAIREGDKIEWTKGEGASHARCVKHGAPTKTAKSAKTNRAPSYPTAAPEPGAHAVSGRRTDRNDRRYGAGVVLHLAKVAVPGGGPDGHYYTVLACRMSPPNEDNGQFDWTEHAWVRSATGEEAAPVAARINARANRAALIVELERLAAAGEHSSDDAARKPTGLEFVLAEGVHGSGRRIAVLTDDGLVAVWSGGHYDDYRQSLATTRDPRAVEIITALITENK